MVTPGQYRSTRNVGTPVLPFCRDATVARQYGNHLNQ
jgi:hypothetical protein